MKKTYVNIKVDTTTRTFFKKEAQRRGMTMLGLLELVVRRLQNEKVEFEEVEFELKNNDGVLK